MKNKTIKSMFNEKIDKEEIYNNVLNHKKRKKLKSTSIVVATLIIICSIVFLNYHSKKSSTIQSLQDESMININIVTDICSNCSLSAEPSLYTQELASIVDYDSKINEDEELLKDINISDDLKLTSKLAVDNLYDDIKSFPIYELVYKNIGKKRKVKILYSKDKYIIENYKLVDVSNTSKINNTELLIYNYKNTYRAIFTIDNIYYRIESENITEEEFMTLLKSIIKE